MLDNARNGDIPATSQKPKLRKTPRSSGAKANLYAAIDLGTNNCRLLIVEATRNSFRVRDSFSRIVRLGEGLEREGVLSEGAMARTLSALSVCAGKIRKAGVSRVRCVATEACRDAHNGLEFIKRVRRETGLRLEIIDGAAEAELATIGCGSLFENRAAHIIVFDIGGGSTEIMRLDKEANGFFKPADVASLPLGVVRLAERFGGPGPHDHGYAEMVAEAKSRLSEFLERQTMITDMDKLQIIGTSGTVTTLAAVQLGLARYDRNLVDGCKIAASDVRRVIDDLCARSRDELAANPCIGKQRADLVLAGCAVLDVIHQHWAVDSFSVADRGLREGILLRMIRRDRRRSRQGRRRRGSGAGEARPAS